MKITFIYPDFSTNSQQIHHGIASLSAVLKKGGHQTSLIHLCQPLEDEELIEELKMEEPDLIAFSSTTNMFPYVRNCTKWIKGTMNRVLTICGGVHPTLSPEESLRESELDVVCVGEGEYALLELCDHLEKGCDFTKIENLWIKHKNEILKNPIRPLIDPLDTLPMPDRNIFDLEKLSFFQVKGEVFIASRGCPYQCSYCCNHALQKVYSGKGRYVRFRSINHILGEIEQAIKEHSYIKYIYFDDDILPIRKDWFRDFCREYKGRVNLPFSCNLRANLVDEEIVNLLKDAGCFQVKMGIESGNEYIRNEILKRHLSNEQIKKGYILCRESGLRLVSYNMVGMPFEDVSQMLETVKLNAQAGVEQMGVSIFYPYPGSTLYQLCQTKDLLTDRNISSYFDGTILRSPLVSEKAIIFFRIYFEILVRIYSLFYKYPAIIPRQFISILDRIISWPHLPYSFFIRISLMLHPRKILIDFLKRRCSVVFRCFMRIKK